MRLLHTSDWHLGRSFHRESLHDAQRAFLDHLVAVAGAERVDAVLVAGDVYDRALPGLEAVALFDDVLVRLAGLGVPTVFISGNHDSARRLGVGSRLIDRAGIHLRTDPDGCADPVLLAQLWCCSFNQMSYRLTGPHSMPGARAAVMKEELPARSVEFVSLFLAMSALPSHVHPTDADVPEFPFVLPPELAKLVRETLEATASRAALGGRRVSAGAVPEPVSSLIPASGEPQLRPSA